MNNEIVVPGEILGDSSELRAGVGTYEEGGNIYSSVFGKKEVRSSYVNVHPFKGAYIPKEGDQVLGVVKDIDQTIWLVDVRGPFPAVLHSSETPWKVEFGDTGSFLSIGDVVLTRIKNYDDIGKTQITMGDRSSRKISSGYLIEILTNMVARVIGKEGSMISAIKKQTGCRIFIGQNGRVWIDGDNEGVLKAITAIKKVEREDVSVEDMENFLR